MNNFLGTIESAANVLNQFKVGVSDALGLTGEVTKQTGESGLFEEANAQAETASDCASNLDTVSLSGNKVNEAINANHATQTRINAEILTAEAQIEESDKQISEVNLQITDVDANINKAEGTKANLQGALGKLNNQQDPEGKLNAQKQEVQSKMTSVDGQIEQMENQKGLLETQQSEIEENKKEQEEQKENLDTELEGLTADEAALKSQGERLAQEAEGEAQTAQSGENKVNDIIAEAEQKLNAADETTSGTAQASDTTSTTSNTSSDTAVSKTPAASEMGAVDSIDNPVEQENSGETTNDTPVAQQPAQQQAQQPAQQQTQQPAQQQTQPAAQETVTNNPTTPSYNYFEYPELTYADRIFNNEITDYGMIDTIASEFFSDNIIFSVDDVVGMSAQDAIGYVAENAKMQEYSKVVYKTAVSTATDSASIDENRDAVSDFIAAYIDASDKINAPDTEFLSLTDKSNYENVKQVAKRIDGGEYILTKEVKKNTQTAKGIQVTTAKENGTVDKQSQMKGDKLLQELETKITTDETVKEDENDKILTQKEYEDLDNFFANSDNTAKAYNELVDEAEKYGVYANAA